MYKRRNHRMRVMIAKNRQTGLVVILIGLMITIVGLGQHFESKLKMATLIQNNIGSFTLMNLYLMIHIPMDLYKLSAQRMI